MKKTLLAASVLFCMGVNAREYSICTWQDDATSAISFTYDDGCPNQYKTVVPMMNRYNLRGTFYTITDWADNGSAIGWDQLREMSKSGHEIGSHTITHPNSVGAEELIVAKQKIEKEIGVPCISIAYPYCNYPRDQKALESSYISGRICNQVIMPNNTTDYYRISSDICGTQGPLKTFADFQKRFEQARDVKGWCILLIHEIDNGSGYSPVKSTELDPTFSYLDQHRKDYWTDTFANISLYLRERNSSSVSEVSSSRKKVVLSVTAGLDQEIYNYPLTLCFEQPKGWKNVSASQGGHEVKSWVENGKVYVYAVPDAGNVELKKSR